MNRYIRALLPSTREEVLLSVTFFCVYFLIGKLFYYVYYTFETSPAIIWPSIGLTLAAMVLFGYKMYLPAFLAQLLIFTPSETAPLMLLFVVASAYTFQALVSLFVLKEFKFQSDTNSLKNTILLVIAALLITAIEPTIATLYRMLTDTLTLSPIHNWARSWGAGIFSVLVFTSFILAWYPTSKIAQFTTQRERFEVMLAFLVLIIANYVVFWTVLPQVLGIMAIFIIPGVFTWFALRLHPQWLTLAVFITAFQGIMGTIIVHPSANPLNEQLLSIEVYIALVAAIFYLLASVVQDRRVAFQKLNTAYLESVASDKAKNDFIAILAHELRNPLAPIISSLEVLKLETKEHQASDVLASALDHTMMMRRLLDDLLDMARLVQGKIVLRKQNIDLRQIVDQSLASVEAHAKSRSIELRVIKPEHNLRVFADPVRLKQIIINLLNNACKYTQRGGKVEVYSDVRDNTFSVHVKDNGIGISSDMTERIFEPFRQSDNAVRYGTGLGIGLFLTRRLVEMHDGKITVSSDGIGKGSIFTVTLPYEGEAPAPVLPQTAKSTQDTHKILIVDDNQAAANILQKLLRLYGHDAEVSYSGPDALMKISTFDPSVVFLDIGMPDMDGYETARQLRAKNWNGAIVALSGFGQESDKQRSKEAGFNHHLVKPVGIEDILQVLQTLPA